MSSGMDVKKTPYSARPATVTAPSAWNTLTNNRHSSICQIQKRNKRPFAMVFRKRCACERIAGF